MRWCRYVFYLGWSIHFGANTHYTLLRICLCLHLATPADFVCLNWAVNPLQDSTHNTESPIHTYRWCLRDSSSVSTGQRLSGDFPLFVVVALNAANLTEHTTQWRTAAEARPFIADVCSFVRCGITRKFRDKFPLIFGIFWKTLMMMTMIINK